MILNAVYIGPEAEGMALIKPFLDLKPVVQEISVVPWNKLVSTAGFGLNADFCVKGSIYSMYGISATKVDAATYIDAFNELVHLWATVPAAIFSTIELEFFPNQAVVAVPDSATAYPWRSTQIQMYV